MVDTSALLSIILAEPDARRFLTALGAASRRVLPASAYLEAALKLLRHVDPALIEKLQDYLRDLEIELEPFTAEHAKIAVDARRRYGRGPNALNFGDCMVYSVAKLAAAPLLFQGGDFTLTDIEPALPATP